MSIKQSIASLVILLSVSFSAFAGYWNHHGTNKRFPTASAVDSYVKDTWNNTVPNGEPDYIKYYDCYFSYSGTYGVGKCKETGSSRPSNIASFYYFDSNICPDGQELIDNECQIPPPPFCERPDTIQQMDDFRQACYQMGNGFSPDVSCSDATESLDMFCDAPPPESCEPGSPSFPACLDDENKCDENHPDWNPEYGMCCTPENNWCDVPPPESCTIFSPNWPECSGDTDIDPPTGGDLGDPDKPSGGGGGGSTDPDKPEPDVDNTSDTLAAIKAMNKDVNSQLTGINNDMNKNQVETKSALDALKASVDLNTDTVVDNANHVANAIKGQSDMLSGIGNKTNGLLTSANNLLNNGFGQLSNDLDDLESTNQKGFGDVVDAIEGLGKPMVDGGGGGAVVPLYSATQLHNLNAEITVLKNEYKDLLNQYRAYFNFTSDVNGGDYNAHNIELTVRGNVVRQQNAVMAALQDNAGIIGAVVLFVFGLLGIRAIGGAF
ncbi:chemotaxis protein [Vibrio sp. D415a]|uniref:chemotaxis protein n=1 Tax=Vibrio TaxID=662 RepID=UPI001BD48C9D|nr:MULTISPECIES: chemotaxis protein [Vibrio]MBS9833176.1 chemotaxis protein [Vibrio alginolyticus]MDK9726772.1 chemotaxis protein [Vibrio sp. D415a]MDK9748452.1 chemotaxis protein [Vibrio sp. D409a]MDK9766945.1 chemotaxis protein [Vibrio sp. D417a]MDK9789454.1 chemotaxis protein [Vibrio sp. D421a]